MRIATQHNTSIIMSSSGKVANRQTASSRTVTNEKADVRNKYDRVNLGLQGESLVIPSLPQSAHSFPTSTSSTKTSMRNAAANTVSTSTAIVTSTNPSQERATDDLKRQISDALIREKRLKSQYEKLQEELKTMAESFESIKLKSTSDVKTIENLQIESNKYKKMYESEREQHVNTRSLLQKEQELTEHLRAEKYLAQHQYEEKMREMETCHSNALTNLEQKHDVIVKQREQTIDRMKRQMAEAFTDNSWERQMQIEQLQKEVMRLQEQLNETETNKGKKVHR